MPELSQEELIQLYKDRLIEWLNILIDQGIFTREQALEIRNNARPLLDALGDRQWWKPDKDLEDIAAELPYYADIMVLNEEWYEKTGKARKAVRTETTRLATEERTKLKNWAVARDYIPRLKAYLGEAYSRGQLGDVDYGQIIRTASEQILRGIPITSLPNIRSVEAFERSQLEVEKWRAQQETEQERQADWWEQMKAKGRMRWGEELAVTEAERFEEKISRWEDIASKEKKLWEAQKEEAVERLAGAGDWIRRYELEKEEFEPSTEPPKPGGGLWRSEEEEFEAGERWRKAKKKFQPVKWVKSQEFRKHQAEMAGEEEGVRLEMLRGRAEKARTLWESTVPPAPQWLTKFAPSLTAGEPITKEPIRPISGQWFAQADPSRIRQLGAYAEFAGGRTIEDLYAQTERMRPRTPTGAMRPVWRPARQWG